MLADYHYIHSGTPKINIDCEDTSNYFNDQSINFDKIECNEEKFFQLCEDHPLLALSIMERVYPYAKDIKNDIVISLFKKFEFSTARLIEICNDLVINNLNINFAEIFEWWLNHPQYGDKNEIADKLAWIALSSYTYMPNNDVNNTFLIWKLYLKCNQYIRNISNMPDTYCYLLDNYLFLNNENQKFMKQYCFNYLLKELTYHNDNHTKEAIKKTIKIFPNNIKIQSLLPLSEIK